MVQISHSKADALDDMEMDDLLHDTFGQKEKDKKPTPLLSEESTGDKEDEDKSEATTSEPEPPAFENEMTLTEQLEAAKAQAEKDQQAAATKERNIKEAVAAKK